MVVQIEACVSDIGCDAVKTGMLASTAIIDAVAAAISDRRLAPLVVDPVMIAKSGAPLLNPDAVELSRPNCCRLPPWSHPTCTKRERSRDAKSKLLSRSERPPGRSASLDQKMSWSRVVIWRAQPPTFSTTAMNSPSFGRTLQYQNTHGTGCIFASAIAASLAHKKTVRESVTAAKDFITAAIRASLAIGRPRACQSDGHVVPQGWIGRLNRVPQTRIAAREAGKLEQW